MVVERKVATLARSLIRILIARRKEIARATITRSNVSKGGRGGGHSRVRAIKMLLLNLVLCSWSILPVPSYLPPPLLFLRHTKNLDGLLYDVLFVLCPFMVIVTIRDDWKDSANVSYARWNRFRRMTRTHPPADLDVNGRSLISNWFV